MEKISAASAVEWSIELEKALRSKNPGRAVEAISEIGPRLEQWSGEPEPTMAVYNMFGLVPGEDRLFANTILLRLANAFRFGDKRIRLAIVRVFLSELRQRRNKKTSKRVKGILTKARVHNHMELLSRVKVVYDTIGDVESRAMALVIFGCWADFAKDSARIRYLILSSLLSSHVLEVRASMFAAGCFCELADDFAFVVLEKLVDIVTAPETRPTIRLPGLRVFAKMGCSQSIAYKAYKTGLKLLSDSSEEDFLVALLVSLSKLASRSTLLASEQMDLLLLFLGQEKTSRMQAVALRCLHFILIKGMCYSPVSAHVIRTLFIMLDKPVLIPGIQCEALQILRKIHSYKLHSINISEFAQLLTIVENASQSPIMSTSLAAIRVLADISVRIFERTEMISSGVSSSPLLLQVITLILDRIALLRKSTPDLNETHSGVFQEVQSLLNLILLLVGENLDLGLLVLDKINLFIECVVNMHDSVIATRQADALVHEIVEYKREKGMVIRSKLLRYVNIFLVAYLENLNVAGAITSQVFDKVKHMVECVHQCSLFDCYTQIIYSLLLHSQVIWCCKVNEKKKTFNSDENSVISLPYCLYENEIFTLECAKKMLTQRDYWLAYRAGIQAAGQGAWVTATFIFEQLITEVKSASCCCWLKSLAQFAQSEGKVQLLLLRKEGSSSVDWLEMNKSPKTPFKVNLGEISQDTAGNNNEPNYGEVLVGGYYSICSSRETLETAVTSSTAFCFQRWFLALRAKILGTVVDLLKVLGLSNPDSVENNGQVEKSTLVDCKSLLLITQISVQLKRLVQELDLMARSFIGMDSKSSEIIAALALSCSVLAFSTGFALFIPKLLSFETLKSGGLEISQNCLHSLLIQNLVGRLWHIDPEISKTLCLLLEVHGQPKNCFHVQSRNQILSIGCEVRDILTVCNDAVSGIVCLRNEANRLHNEEILSQVTTGGLCLLLDIVMKWIYIPFRIPKHFFKTRPCIGSELFAFNADTENRDVISVLPGFHLSLNLCLQLRNLPQGFSSQVTKLFCLLYCSVSFQGPRQNGENKKQTRWSSPALESDDMVEMNEKLFQYVTEHTKKTSYSKRRRNNDGGDVYAFVCFEPNERGQGFSNCLLDVSHFPEGSYQMKWHSCCIDRQDSYWSLLPFNSGPDFTVHESPVD